MKKWFFTAAAALMLLIGCLTCVKGEEVSGVSDAMEEEKAASAQESVHWQDYNGKRIGILTGTNMEAATLENFPDSEYLYFNGYPDCNTALLTGRIDGYLGDEPALKSVHAEQPKISYLPEKLSYNEYNFSFRKNDPESDALREELNDWLKESWANGTMRDIEDIWFGVDEERKVIDLSDLTGENGSVTAITTSTDMPFSYIKDGRNVGYDIDVAYRFCKARGYALNLFDCDFAARIPALQSGKGDFICTMNVTEERKEQVNFSDLVCSGGMMLAVRTEDLQAKQAPVSEDPFVHLDEMNGKRAGVITGSFHDSVIAEEFPKSSISHYGSYPDLIAALKSGKIEYFLVSADVAESLKASEPALITLAQPVRVIDIGAMFARNDRGETLMAQMNEFIEKSKRDGTLDAISAFWSDPAHESSPVDMSGLTGENGVLKFATSGTKTPISFVAQGQIAGADPDIAARFCREYGYGMEVHIVDTAGIIPGIVTGTYDFSLSDMVITAERKESVNFSNPYRGSNLLVMTLSDAGKTSLFGDLAASFEKTFLREERWRLFASGILTTLLITLLSCLFGTMLGFLLFMMCRRGNRLANGVTRFCLGLVQGMPMVVLLMVLYYIIFGSVAISGIMVAVIGFTLTFGGAVFGMLKIGVGMVDRGQYEAAYALGHSNRHTFFRIILPQAIPHVLPAYQGELVSLIKATAIVGYIAVQDLTKMGDIVRSRTYEAFFPLIAVTIIYFVLEGLLGLLVSRIKIRIDPRKRDQAQILKGVDTHDQD